MRSRGPLVTLLVVAVLAAVLLVVNLSQGAPGDTAAAPGSDAPSGVAAPGAAPPAAGAPAASTAPAAVAEPFPAQGWYQGTATDGSVQAKGRGANALTGTLSGGTLSGTVSAGGRSWSYSAAPSAAPAGLYRSKTPNATVGWIKDSNGQVTGLANEGGTVRPAPPLDPGTATAVEGGDQVVGQ